jgi:hypothetical protein
MRIKVGFAVNCRMNLEPKMGLKVYHQFSDWKDCDIYDKLSVYVRDTIQGVASVIWRQAYDDNTDG